MKNLRPLFIMFLIGSGISALCVILRFQHTFNVLPSPPLVASVTQQTQNIVLPEKLQRIEALNPQDFADGPAGLRGSNSIWRIGVIPGSDLYTYITVYVLARPAKDGDPANIITVPDGLEMTEQHVERFLHYWPLPNVGDRVIITGLGELLVGEQGVSGKVYFMTVSGECGSLDFQTGEVALNGISCRVIETATVSTLP